MRKSLAIFHRTISGHYQKKAKAFNLLNPKVGAITVVQRFGGALNLNVHFNTIYTDGVFHENYLGEEVFREIIPSHEEVELLTAQLKKRLGRLMAREENIINEDLSLAQLQAQSVQNRDEKFKLPIPLGKICDPPFREFKGWRCCYNDGFSLHANVKFLGNQREGLERLCRYILRGPIAKDRISYDDSGKVRLKLKTPYSDGTTHLQFTPDQFIKRVISLIPPPRQNLIRYIGVFGARHKKRSVITAMARPKKVKTKKKVYRTAWGELLKHVFKCEVNYCDHCGTKLELIATITSRYVCQKILKHLGLPVHEVNASSPRAPPELDYFDQIPEYL
ncbi:MAG: transposase [Bacteriovorax sp.]|nr:transposase [Bacteriovorax sp.]